ncbi:MAG: helix-turn-helix domain-containing protein [Lacibacter sp.]
MQDVTDILDLAYRQPLLQQQQVPVHCSEKHLPGAVTYSVYRYPTLQQRQPDEVGVLAYRYHARRSDERSIELRFCINGNRYCTAESCNGTGCRQTATCRPVATVDVLVFRYPARYLAQFVNKNAIRTVSDELLAFRRKTSFTTSVQLCGRIRSILDSILQHNYSNGLETIFLNSQLQALLLYGLECLAENRAGESFACKFLSNETDREKIVQARDILLQRIGEPITIKELSRKVGTNECYLKKGFKELFGTTIFDFYQSQRMEHARYLLYEKGLSVTEVSMLLGYSSISHFSTAFKKHTGLKPCELLLR